MHALDCAGEPTTFEYCKFTYKIPRIPIHAYSRIRSNSGNDIALIEYFARFGSVWCWGDSMRLGRDGDPVCRNVLSGAKPTPALL